MGSPLLHTCMAFRISDERRPGTVERIYVWVATPGVPDYSYGVPDDVSCVLLSANERTMVQYWRIQSSSAGCIWIST